MTTIEIDFEAYKKLTLLRQNEDTTYNDVIRELLDLQPTNDYKQSIQSNGKYDWVTKNVRFPHGTPFRMLFKGISYPAIVNDGSLELNGIQFNSPSAAANHITNKGVNGWIYWECKLSESSPWVMINSLRRRN